jgi:hypothetical protein
MFKIGVATHTGKRPDGTPFRFTIPVDFPIALDVTIEGETLRYFHEQDGYRESDRKPAGLYANDVGEQLWFCEGEVF